jgi:metallo-beta-lactamase class B
MMGIGGGTFSVMTLTLFNTPIHRAVGTAALLGLVIAVPATIAFIVTGFNDVRLPPGSLGYVNLIGLMFVAPTTVLCAPLGAKLAHGISAKRLSMLFGLFLLIAAGRLAFAQEVLEPDPPFDCYSCAEWNQPQPPFHIFGNTYYVGVAGISVVLIDAGSELLLIDGGLSQSAEIVADNIRKLGFDPLKISTIAVSHAHYDHVGGVNALQKYTGAQVLSSEQGARALRAGDLMQDDPSYGHGFENRSFPAVQNVEVIADGVALSVGNTSIINIYTPGHTPGGMSWTWNTCEEQRCLDIVYADSISAASAQEYRFTTGLGDALNASAERIASLDCDILLVTHPFLFEMKEKYTQGPEAFIDDRACKDYGQKSLEQLLERLASE